MKRSWRTCAEHPHCQEEIQETTWDDRPNTYTAVHHRDAKEQNDSPSAPERFVKAYELGVWVDKLDHRAESLVRRISELSAVAARIERSAIERVAALDDREQALNDRQRLLDRLRRDYLADQLDVKEALQVLEDRTRPWYEKLRGAR